MCHEPVGGEKHDTLIVLEHAEEDRDQLVALELVQAALLEKYICFVQQ